MIEKLAYLRDFRSARKDRWQDEPITENSFTCGRWILRPKGTQFRIFEYPDRTFNKFGLEALINNQWVTVEAYDDGYDDYGKLYAGIWKPLSDHCSWDPKGLRRLVRKILGVPEPKEVKEVLGAPS